MLQSWRYSLVGAMYDHPLSQMSVGYKHLIGVDGVKADCDVAMGVFIYLFICLFVCLFYLFIYICTYLRIYQWCFCVFIMT